MQYVYTIRPSVQARVADPDSQYCWSSDPDHHFWYCKNSVIIKGWSIYFISKKFCLFLYIVLKYKMYKDFGHTVLYNIIRWVRIHDFLNFLNVADPQHCIRGNKKRKKNRDCASTSFNQREKKILLCRLPWKANSNGTSISSVNRKFLTLQFSHTVDSMVHLPTLSR